MLRKLIIPLLVASLAVSSTHADELRMKNGSHIIGKLVSIESDKVIFSTPFAGNITISQTNINLIITENPVTLKMVDGTIYRDRQIISTEDSMRVEAEGESPVTFATEDIEMVNPEPWKLGDGYDWTGRVSFAAEAERGNSDSSESYMDFRSNWVSLVDRYTLKGDREREKSNDVVVEDNWTLMGKYDRFIEVGGQNYRGASLRFAADEFEDLELRTIIGPHIGRQFSRSSKFKLEMEAGPVWVDERYLSGGKDSWAGAMWFIEESSDIVGYGSTLYLIHNGILKIEDASETILDLIVGIRFPLILGFETSFEVKYEYDGGPEEDIEKLDTTYNLKLGYAW